MDLQDETQDTILFQGQEIKALDASDQPTATESDDSSSTEATPREASKTKEANDQVNVENSKPPMDWEKSYKELEKKYTKDSQRRSYLEKQYQELVPKYQQYEQYMTKISQDQEALQYLQNRWNRQPQVDPSIQNDPLYQYLKPITEEVQNLRQFKTEFEQRQAHQQAEATLDKEIGIAQSEYEKVFGNKPTNEDIVAVYDWMAQHGHFNGKAAIRDLYFDKAAENRAQKALESQTVKKNMGTTKVTNMNSSSAKPNVNKSMSFREAYLASKEELGA